MDIFEKIYIKGRIAKASIRSNIKCMDDGTKSIYKKCFAMTAAFAFLFAMGYFILNNSFLATGAIGYQVDVSAVETGFKDAFNKIYSATIGASSVIAVTLVAYNIVMIMTSKNQRKISDAFTWIRAIMFTWLCIACAGFFIKLAVQGFTTLKAPKPIIKN